jgi:hypothetical protein
VTSQYCGQRVDVLLRGSTSDEEEKGIWVGDWKDSRKARLIMSCRHSAGGLQFPGFWNGRSPPNSISRRRRCQCKQTTAETTRHDTKRGLVEGSVQTLRASRAIPWASSVPGADSVQRHHSTFFSCREPCLIGKRVLPASWLLKSCKQDSRSKGDVYEVGVERKCVWRRLWNRGPLFMSARKEPRNIAHVTCI